MMLAVVVVSQVVLVWYAVVISNFFLSQTLGMDIFQKLKNDIINQLLEVHRSKLIILLGIDLVFAAVAGVVISHQTAGPLVSLQRRLKELEQGDLVTEVHFRQGDSLRGIGPLLNGVTRAYRHRLRELKQLVAKVSPGGKEPSGEEKAVLQEIKRILDMFRTE